MRWQPHAIADWAFTIWAGAYVGAVIGGMALGLAILWATLFP